MVFVMTLERVRGRGAVVSVGRALRRERALWNRAIESWPVSKDWMFWEGESDWRGAQ